MAKLVKCDRCGKVIPLDHSMKVSVENRSYIKYFINGLFEGDIDLCQECATEIFNKDGGLIWKKE